MSAPLSRLRHETISISLSALKASKVAGLNKEVIEELENHKKGRKKRVPSMPCKQVLWMGGQLAWWALTTGIMVEKEFRFCERRWRFDFALPDKKIALEYNGTQSAKSRHTTLAGYTGDRTKINHAQSLGWKVLEFTVLNYRDVLKELEKNIEQ